MSQKDQESMRREEISTQEQNVQEIPQTSSEKDAKLGVSMLSKITLAVVILVSLVISISCLMQYNQNQQDIQDLKKDLEMRNDYIREMQDILNSDMDEEYIIQQAREKLGYYFPDEEIFQQDVND